MTNNTTALRNQFSQLESRQCCSECAKMSSYVKGNTKKQAFMMDGLSDYFTFEQDKNQKNRRSCAQSKYTMATRNTNDLKKDDSQITAVRMTLMIKDLMLEKNITKYRSILDAILEDRLQIYKKFREPYNKKLQELSKERIKIKKRKKTEVYKRQRLQQNTRETLLILMKVLGSTVKYFSLKYYESYADRAVKLRRVQQGQFYYKDIIDHRETFESLAMKALFFSRQREMKALELVEMVNQKRFSISQMVSKNEKTQSQEKPSIQSPPSVQSSQPQQRNNSGQQLKDSAQHYKDSSKPINDKTRMDSSKQLRDSIKDNIMQKCQLENQKSFVLNSAGELMRNSPNAKNVMDIRVPIKSLIKPERRCQTPLLQAMTDEYMQRKKNLILVSDSNNIEKEYIKVTQQLIKSPFMKDRKFVVHHLVKISRDELFEKEKVIENLFYDDVFKMALSNADPWSMVNSYTVICNLMESQKQRKRLDSQNYLSRIYKFILNFIEQGEKDAISPISSPFQSEDSEVLSSSSQSPSKKPKKLKETLHAQKDSKELMMNILLKVSWLTCLIAFNVDEMEECVNSLQLFYFIRKIIDPKNSDVVRANGILAISLLCYNSKFFNQILNEQDDLLDFVVQMCLDSQTDNKLKLYASQVIVQYALNSKSVDILIQKGVFKIFQTYDWEQVYDMKDPTKLKIKTNIIWIFQAMCNHHVDSKEMLERGITRDMFLVACNPQYNQLRHLVITSFALLGRYKRDEQTHAQGLLRKGSVKQRMELENLKSQQDYENKTKRIQSTAGYLLIEHINQSGLTKTNIQILLSFASSDDLDYQYSALQTLKDYVFSNHESLVGEQNLIYQAFLFGCLSSDFKIQLVCANAVSFLVIHKLVYKSDQIDEQDNSNSPSERKPRKKVSFKNQEKTIKSEEKFNVLDSLMYLSSSQDEQIRSIGFSTLSALANLSSIYPSVQRQIHRDLKIFEVKPPRKQTTYFEQLLERLRENKRKLFSKIKQTNLKKNFTGLFCLCKLSYGAVQNEIYKSIDKFLEFITHFKRSLYKSDQEKRVENTLLIGIQNIIKKKNAMELEDNQVDAYHQLMTQLRKNEQYFNSIFKALMNCEDHIVLIKMLKVIQFYSECFRTQAQKDQSGCWDEVINSQTVLWLLQIIQNNMRHVNLCCLSSLTLLGIVENHQIKIDVHEGAIKKAYNKVFYKMQLSEESNQSNFSNSYKSIGSESFSSQKSSSFGKSLNDLQSNNQDQTVYGGGLLIDEGESQGSQDHIIDELNLESQDLQKTQNLLSESLHTSITRSLHTSLTSQKQGENPQNQKTQNKRCLTFKNQMDLDVREVENLKYLELPSDLTQNIENIVKNSSSNFLRQPADKVKNPLALKQITQGPKKVSSIVDLTMQSGIFFKQKRIIKDSDSFSISQIAEHRQNPYMRKNLISMKSFQHLNFAQNNNYHLRKVEPIKEIPTKNSEESQSIESSVSESDNLNLVSSIIHFPNEQRDMNEDQAIERVIDQIWENFDEDRNGELDKQETMKFVQNTLCQLGSNMTDLQAQATVDVVFDEFDADSSGTIDKEEIVLFIKRIIQKNQPSGSVPNQVKNLKSSLVSFVYKRINQQTNDLYVSEESDSSDEEDDLKDTTVAIQYVNQMYEKLQSTLPNRKSLVNQPSKKEHESDSQDFSEIYSENQEEKHQFQKVTFRILTDSIIKSFMITFTDPGNRNLLMNPDLIQIALQSIEYGPEIKTLAQVKAARLLSLVLQFPQVQKKIIFGNDSKALVGMFQLIFKICEIDAQLKYVDPFDIKQDNQKLDKKKLKLRTQIETLKYLIKGAFIVCRNPKLSINQRIIGDLQQSLLEVIKCKNILKHLDQLDKVYLLMSIRNIHTFSDQSIRLFIEQKSYEYIYQMHVLMNGSEQFQGDLPRNEKIETDEHGNIGNLSISEDIPMEISNTCLSILSNLFSSSSIAKLILQEKSSQGQVFELIMKGIDESNDWQDLSIFNSIRTFLKLIDEDIIKRGIDYKFSSRAILPESNVMISGSEKSLVLDIIPRDSKVLKIQSRRTIRSLSSQPDASPENQEDKPKIMNMEKIKVTPKLKQNLSIQSNKERKKSQKKLIRLRSRSSTWKMINTYMDIKQEKMQKRKDLHIKNFKTDCKNLFLVLQIRINAYNLIVGISKEGLTSSSEHLQWFQKDFFGANKLMSVVAQDLEYLCQLISQSNEFRISKKQMIETPELDLDLVFAMQEKQHILLMELFDCVMNCLRVIQCDIVCINSFLTNIEDSIYDEDDVKVSRNILNSIDILAKHNDTRSKLEIIRVIGVILIEKISEDADFLNNSSTHREFDGIKMVSQVNHRLFNLFSMKNISFSQDDHQSHQQVMNEMLSLSVTLLKHASQIVNDRRQFQKIVQLFIDESILKILFDCIDLENKEVVLNSLELLSLALENYKIAQFCQRKFNLDCIQEQNNEDSSQRQDTQEDHAEQHSKALRVRFENDQVTCTQKSMAKVLMFDPFSDHEQIVPTLTDNQHLNIKRAPFTPKNSQTSFMADHISIKDKLLQLLQKNNLILQDSKIQVALSNCLLQVCMFDDNKRSKDESKNKKRYCKFLIDMGLAKNYVVFKESEYDGFHPSLDSANIVKEIHLQDIVQYCPESPDRRIIQKSLKDKEFDFELMADLDEFDIDNETQIQNEAIEHSLFVLTKMIQNFAENHQYKILKSLIESGLIKLCEKVLLHFIALVDTNLQISKEKNKVVNEFIQVNLTTDSINTSNSMLQPIGLPIQSEHTSFSNQLENLDLLSLSSGAIQLIKNMTKILQDLSFVGYNTLDTSQSLDFVNFLIQKTQYLSILKSSMFLIDLDVQSNLITSIGNLMLVKGPNNEQKLFIQGTMVDQQFMPILVANLEAPVNAWLTLKNLSNNIFNQIQLTDAHVFRFYQKLENLKLIEETSRGQESSSSKQKIRYQKVIPLS